MRLKWEGDKIKAELEGVASAALLDQALSLRDHVVEKELSGQSLNVRTGALRRSMTFAKIDKLHYRVGTNLKYARIHEEGGTITAKKSKFLLIPTGFALTSRGNVKGRYKNGPQSLDDKSLTWIPRRGGGWVVLHQTGKTKRTRKLVYVLVPSVRIKGKKYMERSFRARAPKIDEAIGRAMGEALKRGGDS